MVKFCFDWFTSGFWNLSSVSFALSFWNKSAVLIAGIKLGYFSGWSVHYLIGWHTCFSGNFFAAIFFFRSRTTEFINYVNAYGFIWNNMLENDFSIFLSTTNLSWLQPAKLCFNFYSLSLACDGCKENPIQGKRFKCIECLDFDLCYNCRRSGIHDNHQMELIKVNGKLLRIFHQL